MNSIIHFSGDDYWLSYPHSRLHIIKAFSQKGYKVLWINPLGTRFPSIKKKTFFLKKIIRKITSIAKLLKKIDTNFYVYTPISLPIFRDNLIQKVNLLFWRVQITFLQYLLNIKNPILFFSSPVYGRLLAQIKHYKSIYYYSDLYTEYRELTTKTRTYIEKLDEILYTNSDVILCASRMIFDNLKTKSTKQIYYLPHQVSFHLFQKACKENSVPADIGKIKKPIIGYYGSLTESNDWDLIEYCSKLRPNYNFVFIGRKDLKLDKIETLPNILFLGKKNYDEIPYYAAYFDVCIMFWIRREWIKNCSPLKLKEYLSAGKPVVSTYIEELDFYYKDIIYLSKTREDFIKNIDTALTTDNVERINKGIKTVENDSWLKAADKIEELLNSKEKDNKWNS